MDTFTEVRQHLSTGRDSPPGSSVQGILQEYEARLSFPSPGDLPNAGIKPRSPALQLDSFIV